MLVVGLTGGIGSGKSTVAKMFAQRGVPVIDTDLLAREVAQPGKPALKQIVEQFGNDILAKDGTLDRAKLRKLVFKDNEKRHWLEQLLHPLIRDEVKHAIQKVRAPYCLVVIPLLFETGENPLINRVLVVDAVEKLQIRRATERDNISEDEVKAILKTQVDRIKRLKDTDDIINNNDGYDELIPQVEKMHEFYLSLSGV